MEVVSLCQEFANEGVVGIDIAGDEPVWEGQAMEGHVIAYKVSLCFSSVCGLMVIMIYPEYIYRCVIGHEVKVAG